MNRIIKLGKRGIALAVSTVIVSMCGCGSAEEVKNETREEAEPTNTTIIIDASPYEEETTTKTEETIIESVTIEDITKYTTNDSMNKMTSGEQTTIEETKKELGTEKITTTTKPTTTAKQTTIAQETTTAKQTTTVAETTTQATTTQATTTQATTTQVTTTSASVNGAFKTFSVQTLDGQTYTQDIFSKADVNVVIIWTTWCGYCKLEMPALQKVMEKYSGQSIQFFSLVCDVGTYATEDEAKKLLADKGVTFPCMIYNDSISDGYMESLTGYPKTLYLNKNGQIMYEVGGAYAGYGEDYAVECHSYYVDWFLSNPDYVAE